MAIKSSSLTEIPASDDAGEDSPPRGCLQSQVVSSAAERRDELKAVWRQAQACTNCQQLASTRQTVVFGSGNADADLMFVGEAPGANEDRQGLPFVGQAGRLLDTLLGEIGLTRDDVFVANVLKCRPPGNRDPLPQEIDACQDYLFRQLELIEPRVVCTLGNFSTKLLRDDPGTGITRLHGREEERRIGPRNVRPVPDLPPGRGALHAEDAGDPARRLRAAAGAAGAAAAAAARARARAGARRAGAGAGRGSRSRVAAEEPEPAQLGLF